jgi:uncharacterized protein
MTTRTAPVRTGTIDCAVHVSPKNAAEIKGYLAQPWKHRFEIWSNVYYDNPVPTKRTIPPDNGRPGSDPLFLRQQLVEPHGIAHAVLLPRAYTSVREDPDAAAANAAGYNMWLAETWLGPTHNADGVFKGSITVAHQDPAQGAKEIDRCAGQPHFVQVVMDAGARAPFGQRHYYPIYEACARHKLPLAIQPGTDGMGINVLASPGYPSHFLEFVQGYAFGAQAHLLSLLTEGVFERFPDLRIIFTESGVAWLPALMWRLDQEYKGLRSEVPWLTKPPSHYLRDHVRFTTQPLERPERDGDLLDVLEMFEYDRLLMYSSEYPDEFFAGPDALAFIPDAAARQRILSDNARELYRL